MKIGAKTILRALWLFLRTYILTSILLQDIKTIEGEPLKLMENFRKKTSLNAKILKGDPLVSLDIVWYAEKKNNSFGYVPRLFWALKPYPLKLLHHSYGACRYKLTQVTHFSNCFFMRL